MIIVAKSRFPRSLPQSITTYIELVFSIYGRVGGRMDMDHKNPAENENEGGDSRKLKNTESLNNISTEKNIPTTLR